MDHESPCSGNPDVADYRDLYSLVAFVQNVRVFILSGYFSVLIIRRRGKAAWFSDRVERLGVPFVASIFTIGVAINVLQRYTISGQLGMPSWNSISIGYLWFLIVLLMYVVTLYLLIDKSGFSIPSSYAHCP
jgi:hypothetical protein